MEIREMIVKYLEDDTFYNLKSQEIIFNRKYKNYYCKRHNGEQIPLKEIGDLFGLFESFKDDHTNKLLPQLLEMNIPVYAKRHYETVELKYQNAIDKGLLVFE